MAYDVTEERLKVKGSEQITRDLKINRDLYVEGTTNISGDLDVPGELIARKDLSVSGDLYVNGKEYINDSETAQTTDDYLVLRHNQTTSLGANEYSGVAVHNYTQGKTATITTDKDGTWRVADNTETDTNYTNISYYDGVYYTELTRNTTTVISGMKTTFDEDELDECVYYNTSYYHFDGNNWFPVSLVDNKLTLGSVITDSTVIAALNALTKEDLIYFRSLTVTVINPVENQPLLTRDEVANLTNGQALTWDATNQKAIGKTIDTTVTANSSNLITSGAVDTAISNTIDGLDVSDTAVSGQYVSEVSETDGKISVTRENLPNTINNAKSLNGAIVVAPNSRNIDVALPGFVLTVGARFILDVKNDYRETAQYVTIALNVNSTGYYTIICNGTLLHNFVIFGTTTVTLPAGVYSCFFDGNNWCLESTFEASSARNAGGLGGSARLTLFGSEINSTNLRPLSNLHPYIPDTDAQGNQLPNYFSCIGSFGTSAVIYASTVRGSNTIAGFALAGATSSTNIYYYTLDALVSRNFQLKLLVL